MKIEFDVMTDTPLALADAIIKRENAKAINGETYNEKIAMIGRENIRELGQALLNYVWSQDRLEREFEKRGDSNDSSIYRRLER